MQCSFEETIDLPGGGYRHTKCINRVDILIINDPCYGLCFGCAYKQLRAENKRLKEKIVQLKTQLLPNELEQNTIEAMDEGKTLKEKQ